MGIKVLVKNRKAFHDYEILDSFEAGVALVGTEVKSLRAGKANLTDGWVDIDNNIEATLHDIHISHYSHGNIMNHNEKRPRKLLIHKKEVIKLSLKVHSKGLTLIPLKVYFKGRYIKFEIGLAKGKKLHDKRESSKKKDANRQIERAIKGR